MPPSEHDPEDAFEEARPVPPKGDQERRRPRRPLRDPAEEDDEPVATIIPYKNPKALLAYYCGVFGLIPCAGLVLGPTALILGILGLRYVRANPSAKGTGHAITGIVLGSLELLANWGGVIALLVLILMGSFKR